MKCRLIFHNILHNRKKAVRAIISICFSVMLIFSSINAYISFQDMRLQNAYQTNGEYNMPAFIIHFHLLHTFDRPKNLHKN